MALSKKKILKQPSYQLWYNSSHLIVAPFPPSLPMTKSYNEIPYLQYNTYYYKILSEKKLRNIKKLHEIAPSHLCLQCFLIVQRPFWPFQRLNFPRSASQMDSFRYMVKWGIYLLRFFSVDTLFLKAIINILNMYDNGSGQISDLNRLYIYDGFGTG